MPDENPILTALGLDTSQFEGSTAKATGSINAFTQAANVLHRELASIPIIGAAYSATFGRIVEGFAQTREEARQFALVMRTDVDGSLEGTLEKIEDINDSVHSLQTGGFGRWLSDVWTNASRIVTSSKTIMGALGKQATPEFKTVGDDRAENIAKADSVRKKLIQDLIPLYEKEAVARSSAYSKSLLQTEVEKIRLKTADQIATVEANATRLYGPDVEKRSADAQAAVKAQLDAIKAVGAAEEQAAVKRQHAAELNRLSAGEQVRLELHGNAVLQAKEALNLATAQKQNAITKEEQDAANIAERSARYRLELAAQEYAYEVKQADLATKVQELTLEGRTREANQAKIQLQYDTEILKARQQHRVELEKSLELQKKAALLAEAAREYDLGGRGRAQERAEERHARRRLRIVASREQQRADAEARNTPKPFANQMPKPTHLPKPGHLDIKNVVSSSLAPPVKQNPKVEVVGIETFKNDVLTRLDTIATEVSQ